MGRGLTAKQARFVAEYLIDLNATAAAKRAGFSARTAEWQGPQLLGKPHVAAAIAKGQEKRADRTQITQDRVLQELAKIAFFDIRKLYREDGTMKLPHEMDDETAAALVGIDLQEARLPGDEDGATVIVRKAKVIERTGALTLAMRHLGMLTDKLEVKDVTAVADRLRQARERRKG